MSDSKSFPEDTTNEDGSPSTQPAAKSAPQPADKPATHQTTGAQAQTAGKPATQPSGKPATQTAGKRWYTVREAAEYLGVSEPTIFRWMKENLLSFYKVGGSTRFTQEGLDAVVEKSTGLKEAEAATGRCAACGHSVLVEGRVQGMHRLYFKPDHTRFWILEESLVPTRARVCTACGHIQWRADTAKLNRLRPKEENGSAQD